MSLRPDVESMLWIASTRYYLGRMSYAVGDFCGHLIAAWPTLDDSTRNIIRRDVESEFERDDRMRDGWHNSTDPHDRKPLRFPLGMDCDRAEWEKVRKLWMMATAIIGDGTM